MQQTLSSLPDILLVRFREAFIRGVIWAFIGTLYGMLFVTFAALGTEWQIPLHPYLFSGVLAGTIGALIYSSMRLAVLMAIIISPICAILMVYWSASIGPLNLLLIIGAVGAIAGGIYGRYTPNSRVYRADAKTLTGLTAGMFVSCVGLLIVNLYPDTPMGIVICIMCPLTGFLYVTMVPAFLKRFRHSLSATGNGALVGFGVAVFLALCNFVMVHSIDIDSTGAFHDLIHRVQDFLPQAMLGGLFGGGFAGIISSLFFDRWQDL
ncbi:MAG: hypothetical protein QNJ78_08090 [Gammaproteobacteria bacterium]|nr:hypothetical protein [Gammaproteobacteria bacterium]